MCGFLSATSGRVYRDKDPKPEKKSGAGGNRQDPKSFGQKLSQHAVTVLLRRLPTPELNVGVTNRFVGFSLPQVGESLCHKWASLLAVSDHNRTPELCGPCPGRVCWEWAVTTARPEI